VVVVPSRAALVLAQSAMRAEVVPFGIDPPPPRHDDRQDPVALTWDASAT
jgi:hypothetical protein